MMWVVATIAFGIAVLSWRFFAALRDGARNCACHLGFDQNGQRFASATFTTGQSNRSARRSGRGRRLSGSRMERIHTKSLKRLHRPAPLLLHFDGRNLSTAGHRKMALV